MLVAVSAVLGSAKGPGRLRGSIARHRFLRSVQGSVLGPTIISISFIVLSVVFGSPAFAKSKWKSKGQVTVEGRVFSNDQDDETVDQGLGLLARLELYHRHKPFREKARIYSRVDVRDMDRAIFVVEELWAEVDLGDVEIRVGADLLNWSATEAFHPADIINARNLDSDVENYEKLGEPMVQVSLDIGTGSLTAYFFPYYTEPTLPSRRSRLAFVPPSLELGPVIRMRTDGSLTDDNFGPQGALRLTQSFEGIDFSLHAVHHVDRSQPEVLFDPVLRLPRPLFRAVTQIGGTYQQVIDDTIVKVEAGYRIFADPGDTSPFVGSIQERDHLQVAVGVEYGWLLDDAELTVIAEAQSYFLVEKEIRQTLGVFQRDALLGVRLALNDVDSTEMLITGIVDLEDREDILLNASFTQRILTNWSISAAFRMVFGNEGVAQQGFQVPGTSDHVRLFLTRYF